MTTALTLLTKCMWFPLQVVLMLFTRLFDLFVKDLASTKCVKNDILLMYKLLQQSTFELTNHYKCL